jgi:hypothetical protein
MEESTYRPPAYISCDQCYTDWIKCKKMAAASLAMCLLACVPSEVVAAIGIAATLTCLLSEKINPLLGLICKVSVGIAAAIAAVVCMNGCFKIFNQEWSSCDDARRWCEQRCR